MLDGPMEIRIGEYISEERAREKIGEGTTGQGEVQAGKEKEGEIIGEGEERIVEGVSGFQLEMDKDGHLLNKDVIDKINRLL